MVYGDFAGIYDSLMNDINYDSWADFIIKKSGIRPGERAVDAACGTGSITVRLAKAGISVQGCDRSAEMLQEAASKARKACIKIPFVQQELNQLCSHRQVRLVSCVCDGVNYLKPESVPGFFDRAYRLLEKDGMLIFDISSQYKLVNVLGNNIFYQDEDDTTCLWVNHLAEDKSSVSMELTFFCAENDLYRRFDETHIQYAHTYEHIIKWLSDAGFSDVKAYNGYTDEVIDAETQRIVFTALRRQ